MNPQRQQEIVQSLRERVAEIDQIINPADNYLDSWQRHVLHCQRHRLLNRLREIEIQVDS